MGLSRTPTVDSITAPSMSVLLHSPVLVRFSETGRTAAFPWWLASCLHKGCRVSSKAESQAHANPSSTPAAAGRHPPG